MSQSCLVAKGFLQTKGIDYEETFAPFARLDSLHLLLAITALLDWDIHHIDIKSAYLNGDLNEEINMDQLKGFKAAKEENQVCLLKKAIYSLKQAGWQWHTHLYCTLEELGFHKFASGNTLIFVKHHNGRDVGSILPILLIYIHDIAIFGMLTDINVFKRQIAMCYKVSDLGEITHFLRLHIVHDHSKNTLSISQEQYIQRVLTQLQ